MLSYATLPSRANAEAARENTHRNAVEAALRKAAILERVDPLGDAYGAAGQALEDFFKREEQIVARDEDVRGWISTVTERRWINELRYQRRRGYDRLDAPVLPDSNSTLGEMTTDRMLQLEDVVELRGYIHDLATEQREALAYLRAARVQDRHIRIVELALTSQLAHREITQAVNVEFAAPRGRDIQPNTTTQVISRQRERLALSGLFPTVVARLRRARRVD